MAQGDNRNITPSVAKVGLNLDSSTRDVAQGELSWAMSAILDSYDGETVNYSNEPANTLCCTLPSGYKVIGRLSIVEEDAIVLWLTNPTNGASEIGVVKDCKYSKTINALCLNFHIDYPIQKAVYKHTNCGIEVYWVDRGRNGARYLQLNNLPYKETEACEDVITTEIDCNKLAIQARFSIPRVDVEEAITGGALKAGVYQFAVGYSNSLTEPYTSYYSITNEAPAFDNTQPTQNFDFEVGKGFKINISQLDVSGIYEYINVAVIKTVNAISTAELIGTYQITGPTLDVLYTGQTSKSLNIDDIKQRYEIFDKPTDLTTAQDVLIFSGVSEQERLSYQQIANKIHLKWATVRLDGKSHPYANAENAVKYRGYMRDEVYPFEMVVKLKNGYISDGFHIPGRAANELDLAPTAGDDVPQGTDVCDVPPTNIPRWKVYNTGSKNTVLHPASVDSCYEGEWEEGEFSYWESTETYDCNDAIWGELVGKPIRHHKFPDSTITHIHDDAGYIYPIGLRIDPKEILSLVQQSSLTDEQKSNIASISIFRGDRINNSSVIAKGLINNVLKYDTNNKIPTNGSGGEQYDDSTKQNIQEAYDSLVSAQDDFSATAFGRQIDLTGPFYLGQMARYSAAELELKNILELENIYTQEVVDRLNAVLVSVGDLILSSIGDAEKMYDETAQLILETVITIVALQIEVGQEMDDVGVTVQDTDKYMFFPNYLFNDVSGSDSFLENIVYDEDSKQRFAFHSPDTHFYQPSISPGVQLKLETVEYGLSTCHMREVEKHAKYQFISSTGYVTALLAGIGIGFASGTYGVSTNIFNGTAMFTAYQTFLDILYKTVPHKNYAHQFNAVGDYSSFKVVPNNGDKMRSTDIATYLAPGMLNVGDEHTINNFQRESSVYLRTQQTLPYTHENVDVPKDRSKIVTGSYDIVRVPISSYYSALKNEIPNQYGQMYSYETVDTGYSVVLTPTAPKDIIFGGDVFINKFAFKNKMPFFIDNRVGAPDGSDIAYNELSNVGKVKYWFSTDVTATTFSNSVFATMIQHFFLPKMEKLYTTGIIFLFAYGIPYFFCESNVNVDLRQAYNQNEGDFYPRVSSGIPDRWLQEWFVSINNDNSYWYNKSFSKQNKETYISHLPSDYDFNTCRTEFPFRAVFSEPETTTSNPSKRNNWRIFKPSSKFDFPQNYGALISLDGINDQEVLARFENKTLLYNALLTAPTSAAQVYLGKSLFSRDVPPLDLGNTDGGFVGCQHKFFLKTPYGALSVDAKRGQIFLINGKNIEEISSDKYKCSHFFAQNLSFSILKDYPEYDIDNNFNGIGLHGVYDARFNRLLLTKLDYELIDPSTTCYDGVYLRDTSGKDDIISKRVADGYKLKSFDNCKLTFTKDYTIDVLPQDTDIYAYFDATSMIPSDGVAASAALNTWFETIKIQYPLFNGNLYIIPTSGSNEAEQYLKYLYHTYQGDPSPASSTWNSIKVLPDGFGEEGWAPKRNIILLTFVDEVEPNYHNDNDNSFTGQPRAAYIADYQQFLDVKQNFDFFKAVAYPIPRLGSTGSQQSTQSNLLQMIAAIEGRTLSHPEVVSIGTPVDISAIETSNPYQGYMIDGTQRLIPLRQLGWKGVYNKVSPAVDVFSSETFGQELTNLLDLGGKAAKTITMVDELPIINIGDPKYFKNKSFTISFDFDNMRWISLHPYTPLYYVGSADSYFQGVGSKIYEHNKIYTRFNKFNDTLSEYSIEYPIAYKYKDELLQAIQDYTIVRQYNDHQEFVQTDDVYFDEVILYNSQQCSGVRKLSPKPKSINSYLKYPVYSEDNINITFTKSNNFYQYNTFWSVVKDKKQPIWKSSLSSPFKELNQENMNYKKLSYQKAPLMAKDIKIRHILNTTDAYKFISQLITQETLQSSK